MNNSSECPKCAKETLVKRHDDLYQCLSCDFRKDFSKPESDSGGLLGAIVLITLLLFALAQQRSLDSACLEGGCVQQLTPSSLP